MTAKHLHDVDLHVLGVRQTVIKLDGFELKGVRDVKIDKPLNGLATITLELIVATINDWS